MRGMSRHDLTTKGIPIINEFLGVMRRDERSGMGHTWLKGTTHRAHQANLATLGSHHSSDWDASSNAFNSDSDEVICIDE